MCLRVALLGVDEVREFGGVAEEEDGGVVEHPVQVTLFSPEFDREASRVTSRANAGRSAMGSAVKRSSDSLSRSTLTADSGETHGSFRFVSHLAEERSASEVGHIMSNFEVPMGTGSLCVDNTLRNALTVKVCNEVDVVKVCSVQCREDVRANVFSPSTHSSQVQAIGLMHHSFHNSINEE